MYRIVRLLCFVTLLSVLSVPGNSLAENGDALSLSGDNLGRLADAVENLTRLLEKQSAADGEDKELRKLDIAISYLNFRSRRIELMERDLSMTRNEQSRLEDAAQNWQERREQILIEMEEKTPEEKKELEQAAKELEARGKIFTQRLSRIEEDIIIQENRITDLQDQLDAVESYVQQHLEL